MINFHPHRFFDEIGSCGAVMLREILVTLSKYTIFPQGEGIEAVKQKTETLRMMNITMTGENNLARLVQLTEQKIRFDLIIFIE